ncbi:MAG: orotate phosphoribosyltransferase [Deltaproteobacteria bacterium]|nr:orotate phosphoribosyltransferase [Deltaproteobacteria bacterium]
METHQRDFISFLLQEGAVKFGEFILKSGRQAPYFINTGCFDSGRSISELGKFYASHIMSLPVKPNVIFGPAYKGVPLAVATSIALQLNYGFECRYSFDRKEIKDHGDTGRIVGYPPKRGDKVLIVEDVVTAGTTLKEIVPFLRSLSGVEIVGVVVSVDRKEKGSGTASAVDEVSSQLGVTVYPIVTIHDILSFISAPNSSGVTITEELKHQFQQYLSQYGAP